ncbi:MAG TPA: sulfatase-like hydrolase/transferase [Steroidobacteraceae bacterium]|nr:sulfatase-like hydrolase/transferase [Steroidobacteraceae bacterium]
MLTRGAGALLCVMLALGAIGVANARMNVVVVMTDDQRFDTLSKTPNIAQLAAKGVQFTRAYQTTPVCGPARASILSGGFLSQNTGILENSEPNGGAKLFNDQGNLGAVMQSTGYRTLFAGKWVNGYESRGSYVPPGWSRFVGRHSYANSTSWFNFKYTQGSSGASASAYGQIVEANRYTTYYERDQVLNFLDSVPAGQPFFVFWSPSAPHELAMPAPEDADAFPDFQYNGRGVTETDLSDKPRWVRQNSDPPDDIEFIRDQLRSMLSVDRSVAAIVDRVRAMGQLDNTVFILTSDNGYMWNEHGLWRKNKAYDEAMRVSLAVVVPRVAPRKEAKLVAPNLDIGPTVFDVAGVSRKSDGRTLLPLVRNPGAAWRGDLFVEMSNSTLNGNAIWAGVVNQRWKYVRYWTGEEELYDLQSDPYELQSRHADASLETLKAGLAARTDAQLGLAIVPVPKLPAAYVGRAFSYRMRPWGGEAPFQWEVGAGGLPPGLSVNPTTGVISGTPTARGTYQFRIRLTDSVLATQAKRPRTFLTRVMRLVVE